MSSMVWDLLPRNIRHRLRHYTYLSRLEKKFEYTKLWNIESDFTVDEVCVWNVVNQCKKAIDNIGIIIRTRYNCAGCQMHPDFLPLLFNLTIVTRLIEYYICWTVTWTTDLCWDSQSISSFLSLKLPFLSIPSVLTGLSTVRGRALY